MDIHNYYQGCIREEGMKLTISPTCEQKQHSIAICYLYFAQKTLFNRNLFLDITVLFVTFLRPFGFCSWTVACPLLLYALGSTKIEFLMNSW